MVMSEFTLFTYLYDCIVACFCVVNAEDLGKKGPPTPNILIYFLYNIQMQVIKYYFLKIVKGFLLFAT